MSNVMPFQHRKPVRHQNQTTIEGELRSGKESDYIVFRIKLLLCTFEFRVVIPEEGKTRAPVYIHQRLDTPQRRGRPDGLPGFSVDGGQDDPQGPEDSTPDLG